MEANVIEIEVWRDELPTYVGKDEGKNNAEKMFEHNNLAIAYMLC